MEYLRYSGKDIFAEFVHRDGWGVSASSWHLLFNHDMLGVYEKEIKSVSEYR